MYNEARYDFAPRSETAVHDSSERFKAHIYKKALVFGDREGESNTLMCLSHICLLVELMIDFCEIFFFSFSFSITGFFYLFVFFL